MNVIQATKGLVDKSRFSAEIIHTPAKKFESSLLVSVSSVHYCAAVDLFSAHEPHDCFITIINFIGVPA